MRQCHVKGSRKLKSVTMGEIHMYENVYLKIKYSKDLSFDELFK